MDRNQTQTPIVKTSAHKNRIHSKHVAKEAEKQKNKFKSIVLPILLAFIACMVPVVFLIVGEANGVQLTKSKPFQCKMLGDSLIRTKAELQKLKRDQNKYNYEDFTFDSVKMEQKIYDLSKEIKKNKCD